MPPSNADASARIGWDNSDARKGAEEFVRISQRTKERADKILGGIGSGIKFASAFAGFDSVVSGLKQGIGELKRGFDFNRTLADSEVGITNVLRRFDSLNKVAAKNEAAKALQRIIELEPITAGGLQDLVGGFMGTLAAAKGVGLQTMQNVELVAKFANAIANAGLPLDQIRQEFRSILTSTITKDSQVAKILGITNEDMNQMRGDGNAIFEFLTKKLGEFGEAGDSAGVRFSSLASALDQALGSATQQLFTLAVDGAKEFTAQLRDPAYVARMQEAGVSLAKTAAEMGKLLAVAVEIAPEAVQVAAVVARVIPMMTGLAAAMGLMKIQKWAAERRALSQASEQETAALKQETAAVQENTAAHAKNAQAAAAGSQARAVGPVKHGMQMIMAPNAAGGMSLVGFQEVGKKAGEEMVRSFRLSANASFKGSIGRIAESAQGQWLASMNGMSTVMMGSLASMFGARGSGIAGTIGASLGGEMGRAVGPSMMDALTFYMSSTGPKGAMGGLAIQFADMGWQLGAVLGEKMYEAARKARDPYAVELDAGGAMPRIMHMVDAGQADAAKEQLQRDLIEAQAKLNDVRHNGTGGAASELALTNEVDQIKTMLKNWESIVANSKAVREQEQKAAAESEKEMKARLHTWQQIRDLTKEIEARKIDLLPDDKKLQALQVLKNSIISDAGMNATVNQDTRWPDGSLLFRDRVNQAGRVHSTDDLQALADLQQKQGDAKGAAATLKSLQEALAVQQKIREVGQKMAEDQTDDRHKAAQDAKENFRRGEDLQAARIEDEILRLKTASAGVETREIKALQDKLDAMRLARQIEEAGLAAGRAALELAERKVKAERVLSDVLEKQAQQRERAEKFKQARSEIADLQVAELRAKKHTEQADRLERQNNIEREKQRLVEMGVRPDVAQAHAVRAQNAQEDLAALAGDPNARRKVRSRRDGSTAADLSEYDRLNHVPGAYARSQQGISPLAHLQQNTSAWEELQNGKSAWERLQESGGGAAGNPQAEQAAANSADGSDNNVARVVDAALTRIFQELPAGFARALGVEGL